MADSPNYTARPNEMRCLIPSPGGGLLCVRPLGHEHGHIWEHPSHTQKND